MTGSNTFPCLWLSATQMKMTHRMCIEQSWTWLERGVTCAVLWDYDLQLQTQFLSLIVEIPNDIYEK